jgi:curved DNA-binding protein CbpA
VDYTKNYYAVLGVLPSAEIVVIRAAYRALALRYHPDTWAGEKQRAEKKMRELNEAYAVLSNEETRKQYDGNRQKRGFEQYEFENDQTDEAFRSSSDANGSDWATAVEYFPELATLHEKLRATSARLAFAFQTTMLEKKQFERRKEIAADLEDRFLQTYFGSNAQILAYARELISKGGKAGSKAVAVLGNAVDPDIVISRIEDKFFMAARRAARKAEIEAEEAEIAAREAEIVARAAREPAELIPRLVDRRFAIEVVKKLNGSVKYNTNHGWFIPKSEIKVVCLKEVATFATECTAS